MQNSKKKNKNPKSYSERVQEVRQDFSDLIENHYTLCQLMPIDRYALSAYLDLKELKTKKKGLIDDGNDHTSVDKSIEEIERGALENLLSDQTKWKDLENLANIYSTLQKVENDLRNHSAVKSVKPPSKITFADRTTEGNINANAWYAGKVDTIIRRNWMLAHTPTKRSYREEMARTFRWTEY